MSGPRPVPGDRVQHRTTGHTGELVRGVRPWSGWMLVRWDTDGPGMTTDDGLSCIAPELLERRGPAKTPPV